MSNQLQYAVAMLIRLVIRAPFLCIGGIIMALSIDWRLSLVIIAAVPLFVLVIILVMRKTIPLHRTVQGRLDKLTRILRENLSGVRVIRAFARTGEERRRFADSTADHTAAAIRVDGCPPAESGDPADYECGDFSHRLVRRRTGGGRGNDHR